MIDAHYTPGTLAEQMVQVVRGQSPQVVADFSAGDGALLSAAENAFGEACDYLAADIDSNAIARLRADHPTWSVLHGDILSENSEVHSSFIVPRTVDLLLLNPPFSYRGAGGVRVALDGITVRASPAMAFLVKCLVTLREGGTCVAILPANALAGERDECVRQWISQRWKTTTVGAFPIRTFPRVHARTVMVEISQNVERFELSRAIEPAGSVDSRVQIVRGTIPMFSLARWENLEPRSFLHSTELQNRLARPVEVGLPPGRGRSIDGPFIALPRVGSPSIDKLAIYEGEGNVVLSDCVFAIRPIGGPAVESLLRQMQQRFDALAGLYGGSCARYLTVRNLGSFLRQSGFDVEVSSGAKL